MNDISLALIGAGNMGAALLGGLIAQGFPPQKIRLADPNPVKLAALAQQYGIHTTTDNEEAVSAVDAVILAVKPQHMAAAAGSIAAVVTKGQPLVISIAAGIRTATLRHWLGASTRLVRCMPNTPALIGYGACALFAGPDITEAARTLASALLQSTGLVLWVSTESELDTVTALSGSGPAYFFYIIDALEKAAVKLGLNPDNAHKLAIQTALGAARMAAESTGPVSELQRQVTSPGGTTEAALKVFENQHLQTLLAQAVSAARNRSIELAESFHAD